jgi:hypothetical protein
MQAGIGEDAGDLAPVVDFLAGGKDRARNVERREGAMVVGKAVRIERRIDPITDNQAWSFTPLTSVRIAPGKSSSWITPRLSMNPCSMLSSWLAAVPTISPDALMPLGIVLRKPGTSIVVKVPLA